MMYVVCTVVVIELPITLGIIQVKEIHWIGHEDYIRLFSINSCRVNCNCSFDGAYLLHQFGETRDQAFRETTFFSSHFIIAINGSSCHQDGSTGT